MVNLPGTDRPLFGNVAGHQRMRDFFGIGPERVKQPGDEQRGILFPEVNRQPGVEVEDIGEGISTVPLTEKEKETLRKGDGGRPFARLESMIWPKKKPYTPGGDWTEEDEEHFKAQQGDDWAPWVEGSEALADKDLEVKPKKPDTPKEKARAGAGREKKPEITKEVLVQAIDESIDEPSGPPWFQRLYDNLGLDIGGRMARAIDGEVLKFYANQLQKGEKSLEADGRDYNRMMELLIQQSGSEKLEQMRQTGYATRAARKGRRSSTVDWARGDKTLSELGDWLIRKDINSQEIASVLRAAKGQYSTSFGPAMFNVLDGQRIWDSAKPGEAGNAVRADGLNKMGMQRMNEDNAEFDAATQANVDEYQVRRFVNRESKRLADQAVDLSYGQAGGGVKKEKSPSYNELFLALQDLVGETLVIEAAKNKSLERYLDTDKGKRNVYLMLDGMGLSPGQLGLRGYPKKSKKKWKKK